MKRCDFNYELLWIGMIAVIVLLVVSLQPYKVNKEAFNVQPLDSEDPNNHSCVKLMRNSVFLKDHYNKFSKDAKTIASFLEPGLTDVYMETDTKQQLSGMCIIPDTKLSSYKLEIIEDPIKGAPSRMCRGVSNDSKVEVNMPYTHDGLNGCALTFSEYNNDPRKIENVLTNLHLLSNEKKEQIKKKAEEQINIKQNELNTMSSVNNQIVRQDRMYDRMNTRKVDQINQLSPSVDMNSNKNRELTTKNTELKNRLRSTW
jgi:hypothetical protein